MRGAAVKAYLNADVCTLEQSHVSDEQSRHALSLAIRCARIVPQTREVSGERHDARTLFIVKSGEISFALLFVAILTFGESAYRVVPFRFKRVRDQSIRPIHLHIAAT